MDRTTAHDVLPVLVVSDYADIAAARPLLDAAFSRRRWRRRVVAGLADRQPVEPRAGGPPAIFGTAPLPHLPRLGTWACGRCSTTWPCSTARRELLAAYGGPTVALGAYLGLCLGQALDDLPATTVADLYARFLGWMNRVGEASRGWSS